MPIQSDSYRVRLLRRRAVNQQMIAAPPPDQDSDAPAFGTLAHLLRAHPRLIFGTTVAVAAIAAAYVWLAPPVYQASMLIHVEETNPAGAKNALTEVASMFDTKKAAGAEMELLRSRSVIAPAVERAKLYIDARPDYFPLFGTLLRDARPGVLSEPGLFGLGGQLWGSERIDVALFNVPPAMLGRTFVITAIDAMRFSVYEAAGNRIFYGSIGPVMRADTPTGAIELQVTRIVGRPGARFLLSRQSSMASTSRLQRDLSITERGKLSGVIEARLEGNSAEQVSAVMVEIGRQYMAQDLARKSEEAETSLAFLDLQLPKLKAKLEQAESDFNAFRRANGSIDFAEEAKLTLQQVVAAKARRSELLQKHTELQSRFTRHHPVMLAVSGQLREAEREIADLAQHVKTLPQLEQSGLRLSREIKLNTDLYTALANTVQQLRLVSVGKVSNVRMVDAPMLVDDPARLSSGQILAAGAFFGLLLGLGAALVRNTVAPSVIDPMRIEKLLGARVVFATIPHSAAQKRPGKRAATLERQPLLALEWPDDGAIAALRSFRAALRFALPQFENNVVLLAGPTANLGKSFVAANLAVVMAAEGKRVLLVDADVRNGALHRYFGVGQGAGLCEVITGAAPVGHVIRRAVLPNLDFIAAGAMPAEKSDFLMHSDVGALLESVSAHYELVLVDAPPILALADALVLGAHAGAVFLVARAGVSTEREITESVKRLNQAGVTPYGVLFNDVAPRLFGYGHRHDDTHLERLEFAR
ncbi:MAG: polysaccharide biosynthesis tyrosine autokinase [Massilia sp.]|nr:polysaccharide biosynthesis tyrosine autokinase [Massilia sp.]